MSGWDDGEYERRQREASQQQFEAQSHRDSEILRGKLSGLSGAPFWSDNADAMSHYNANRGMSGQQGYTPAPLSATASGAYYGGGTFRLLSVEHPRSLARIAFSPTAVPIPPWRKLTCWLFWLVALQSTLPLRSLAKSIASGWPVQWHVSEAFIHRWLWVLAVVIAADRAAAPKSGRDTHIFLTVLLVAVFGHGLLGYFWAAITRTGYFPFGRYMPVSQWLASWPSLYGPALIVALGVAVFGFRSQQTAATARAASPVDNVLIFSPKLMPTTAPEDVKSRMRVPWVIGPVVGAFILFPGAVVAWLGLLVSSYIYLSVQLPFAESSPASLVVWGATVGVISFKIARAQQAAAKTAASETSGSSQVSSR